MRSLSGLIAAAALPGAAAMAAPREIVSLTPIPQEFEYTRDIFRLHGKRAAPVGETLKVWEHP